MVPTKRNEGKKKDPRANRFGEVWKSKTHKGNITTTRGDARSQEVGVKKTPKKSRRGRKPNVEKTTLQRK